MRRVFLAIAIATAVPAIAGAHEADKYMRYFCSGSPEEIKDCEAARIRFRALYKAAFKNDYQSQRNLAYTLWNGNSAVVKDRKASCAWRVAIIWLGSPKVDESDQSNMKTYCGMLFPDERPLALDAGKIIGRRVQAGGKIDESVAPPPSKKLDATAEPL